MKALWLAKNRRGRRGAPRLSLFPFLAVLICTMGALMLLLLFVTRHVRLQAAHDAAAKDAEKQSSINGELEMVQWRVDQLRQSRKATENELAEAQLVLGHIEDHGRRLRDQFQELTRQAQKAGDEGLKPGRFVPAGEEELRQVEGQVAEAQQRLAQAQQAAGNRPKSYAIIPYDGPNRTRRRPIYIECRGDAVVLQPENIIFTEADFDEPLGPGNPLAAAIRAARQQMLLQGSADPQSSGEPYPLLLVRPDGIAAYEAALAAMKSWGSEFGYELINADWRLKYPPPDPIVAKSVIQAIFLARQEHARLIAAAPSKYGKRPRTGSYRSPTGPAGGEQGGAGEGESPGFYSSKPSERYARSAGGGGSSASGRNGRSAGGSGDSGGSGNGSGSGSGGSSGPSSDADFAAHNPYAELPAPGTAGSPSMYAGGGNGPVFGTGNGTGGAAGSGTAGGFAGGGGNGPGVGTGNGPGGAAGSGVAGGFASGSGNGPGYGTGNGTGGAAGSGAAGGMVGSPSMYGGGGNPVASFNQEPSATAGGGIGGAPGSGTANGFAGGSGNNSGSGAGGGSGGVPGSGVAGGASGSSAMSPGGNGTANAVAGGPAGSTSVAADGVAHFSTPSPTQAVSQANGQPASGSPGAANVIRPDGYISGHPNDAASATPAPPVRPDPNSQVAMGPATLLRPGEWRPSEESPKRDRDEEEKQKEKKKHPYDKVKMDHDQDDWALRKSTRHAAAISRPIHVDCYPDRIVLVPEANSGEPHVIVCDSAGQRDADKLVAAVWEIMDTWGMAGREMYWRPILHFYVAAGAEPRVLDITRSLEGSGLVIERKQ